MCGRYNFSDEQAEEIKGIIREIQDRLYGVSVKTGEIYPTNLVPVLLPGGDGFRAVPMVWGFPHFKSSGVIINARAETVMEKRMFRDSVLTRRCLVPSTGFYEWKKEPDGSKTKLLFRQPGSDVLYMAGAYNTFRDKDGQHKQRFVILTTAANDSMRDTGELSLFPQERGPLIHDRMPVILAPEEWRDWLAGELGRDMLLDRKKVVLEHRIA